MDDAVVAAFLVILNSGLDGEAADFGEYRFGLLVDLDIEAAVGE